MVNDVNLKKIVEFLPRGLTFYNIIALYQYSKMGLGMVLKRILFLPF